MKDIAWIAVDWGTTNLRAYAIGTAGQVLDRRLVSKGMAQLERSAFKSTLLEVIDSWADRVQSCDIIASGMVGAAQGWVDAGYLQVPCDPVSFGTTVEAPMLSSRFRLHILPGLCQRLPDDVMRGEETQIAGFLIKNPRFEGVICLPGTHSKWVRIQGGRVAGFDTYMTGEMFAVLSQYSILRFDVQDRGWDDVAFLTEIDRATSEEVALGRSLFALRASSILSGANKAASKAALSGMLIGNELAANQTLWADKPVAIIGAGGLSRLYTEALEHLGCTPMVMDAEKACVAGLARVAQRFVGGEVAHA